MQLGLEDFIFEQITTYNEYINVIVDTWHLVVSQTNKFRPASKDALLVLHQVRKFPFSLS